MILTLRKESRNLRRVEIKYGLIACSFLFLVGNVSNGNYLSRGATLVFAVARVCGDFSPRTSRPSGALAVKGA